MKKIFTRILVCLLLCVVLLSVFFSSFSKVNAVETIIEHPYGQDGFYSQDPTTLIKTYYDNLSYHSIKFFSASDIVNSSDFKHLLNYVVNQKQTYYIRSLTSVTYRFYAFYNDSPYSYIDTHFIIGDYINVPTQESEMRYNFYYDFGYDNQTRKYFITRVNVTSPNNSIYIPSCLVLYQNSDLQNYFNSLVNNDTKTIINILNVIDSRLDENTKKLEEETEKVIESQKEEAEKNRQHQEDMLYGTDNSSKEENKKKGLIGSILDGFLNMFLKIFIPDNDYFSNFFNELNTFFSDRLGFLYYPFELCFNILNKFLNADYTQGYLEFNAIREPFTGEVIIPSFQLDFFSAVKGDNEFKKMHDLYLTFVDFIIAFSLIKLAIKKWEEVTRS